MRRFGVLSLFVLTLGPFAAAWHSTNGCGTTRESSAETLFLHRQSLRSGARLRPLAATPASANRDIGNIAIIEDSDGVVSRQNQFNLDQKTLRFTPTAPNGARYRFEVVDGGYEASAAASGTPLSPLDDDDTRQIALPFPFAFFGAAYAQAFVNSDGNVTFTAGDSASTERSLGRLTSGPPRLAALLDDLNPTLTNGGVRVLSEPNRVVVSWTLVPEWQSFGSGARQTFQLKLFRDGAIEFSYSGVNPTNAIVGIAPGDLRGATTLVDFRNDPSAEYSGAVAERFGDILQVDPVTVAQKFFLTHEDAYDYLMIYNNQGISASPTAVAYENTVRSNGNGYGTPRGDVGRQFGSASRLQSVVNMGNLGQYPRDPTLIVPLRAPSGDTPLSILAHEAGHLFLAFASVRDPENPSARPLQNTDLAHWAFPFNSDASLLEGERILDRGPGVSPRFFTTDTSQAYTPLDQYLMGWAPPTQVPPSFYVANAPLFLLGQHPMRNISFDGIRRDFTIDDLIRVEGRRTPDSTVAQRRFRFAFILVVPQGSDPSAADLTQVETYRQAFEPYFANVSSNNASADTTLKRSMKLSLFPASGVVAGLTTSATLTLATAPSADLTVQLRAPAGNASLPPSVRIAPGATSVSFNLSGVRAGVEEVTATPSDPAYEAAFARVQVADATLLKLVPVSGDHQVADGAGPLPDPIVVRLTDINNLPYAGARIVATPSAGGSVAVAAVLTDARGEASFRWTPGPASASKLQLAVEGATSASLTLNGGSSAPIALAVANAASFEPGVSAGAIQTVSGVNLAGGQTATAPFPWPATLAGVRVLLNGTALPLIYVSDTQINFYVPQDTTTGAGTLAVVTPSGVQAPFAVNVVSIQPGIFAGAVLKAGTAISAVTTPVRAGDFIEIYCTGLGPTRTVGSLQQTVITPSVFIGSVPVTPVFSGLTPGLLGLYQVNVQVPVGLAPGLQSVFLSVNSTHSNEISIGVQ